MRISTKIILAPNTLFDYLNSSFLITVHSAYHHTINIRAGGQLLSLLPASSIPTPFGLVTALDNTTFERLDIERGEHGVLCRSELSFEKLQIALRTGAHWNPQIHAVPETYWNENFENFLERSIRRDMEKSILAQSLLCDGSAARTPFGRLYRRYIHHAASMSAQGCFSMAAQQYSMLIGLGNGLTPSGDDFLVGLLATLCALGTQPHAETFRTVLSEEIIRHLTKTNDISAEFLKHACRRNFSQLLCSLFTSQTPELVLKQFCHVGHSSGIDTLMGIREGIIWYMAYIKKLHRQYSPKI